MTFVESVPYAKDNREENLHKIVADNPKLVAIEQDDGRRLPTLAIGTHFRLPTGEEIDLLLMDVTGTLTIVELKRGEAPRDVVAQILDYASSLHQLTLEGVERALQEQSPYKGGFREAMEKLAKDNPDYQEIDADAVMENIRSSITGNNLQLLIVSYEIDQSIRKVADFLRNVYGVRLYCVEFDYFSSNEHEYFIPETIGTDDVRRIHAREMTDTEKKYLQFYSELLERFGKKKRLTRARAIAQSWMQIPIGYTNIHLEWAFHGRPRDSFEVGLHLERSTIEENRKILDALKTEESSLRAELGELEIGYWGRGGRWARIRAVKRNGEITEELKEWAVTMMAKFYDVFKPRIDRLLEGRSS